MNTTTTTETYSTTDVQNVVRRFHADLKMIADSTGAMSSEGVANYVHDIELLATKGYLASVDVTLLNFGIEVRAVRYNVDTDAGGLVSSRPGNAMWPRVTCPTLRIVVSYTGSYDPNARQAMSGKLNLTWSAAYDDISHASLNDSGGHNYTSGNYGFKRKDWTK